MALLMVASLLAASAPTASTAAPASKSSKEDAKEVQGRAHFARGEYQSALDIFAELFAEHGTAIYLRNIGRCNQMLRLPQPAIDAFREYLRRNRRISAAEKAEVNGFIREMEALKKEIAGAAPTQGSPASARELAERPAAAASPTLTPTAPQEPPAFVATTSPSDSARDKGAASSADLPLTRRWWFWAGIGVLAAGAVVTTIALTSSGDPAAPTCPEGFACPR